MRSLCEQHDLLRVRDNVVRIPLLIKGTLVAPVEVSRTDIEAAFATLDEDATYARVGGAQVLREPIIDRASMQPTGEYLYQVLAPINAGDLLERNFDRLAAELYNLPFDEVLSYLQGLLDAMADDQPLVDEVRELTRMTAQHPDAFHDAAFEALREVLRPEVALASVNTELGHFGKPGREFLDGWVEVPAKMYRGMSAGLAEDLFREELPEGVGLDSARMRALPTRQLHITAGNAPAIPVLSMLRAIVTKGAAVIKSPYGAVMPGALAALAAVKSAPDHPITRYLSLVYWPGGDPEVEGVFFLPTAFDRIIVWGAPESVTSVRQRAQFTRVLAFNPRYGMSLIGKEAFGDELRQVAIKASVDALIWNQKACIASFVQYVEGTQEQAEAYARELKAVLANWDELTANWVPAEVRGKLRRMKRGKYMHADWHINERDGRFESGVIVMDDQFDMLDHPMSRTIIVRRVDRLEDAMDFLHHGVASVGVYPEKRRHALLDSIVARGVSNVLPLGQVERTFAGMPHDGMIVLTDLVDWKQA